MSTKLITVSFEDVPSAVVMNRIMSVLSEQKPAKSNVFVDYRPSVFEDMVFIPAIQIKGDTHDYIDCNSCEEKVKVRSCSFVILEDDNNPLYLCRKCSIMVKKSMGR